MPENKPTSSAAFHHRHLPPPSPCSSPRSPAPPPPPHRPTRQVRVPRIHWSATSRRVLTMEWIEGVKLTDEAAMAARGLDIVDFVTVGIECTLRQLLEAGFFHAGAVCVGGGVECGGGWEVGRVVCMGFGGEGRKGVAWSGWRLHCTVLERPIRPHS